MNIFQLASNDQAVYYLGFIFGSVGNVLTPSGGGGSITIGIIGTMLKVLNLTALTVGVLVVVYITVVGVLATAHEGQFMGKDWSGLWVPIKTVLGVVALFPSGSGYSIIQILIMWIVIQGVAAADTMWTTVLNYINFTGSPYATVTVPLTSIKQPMQTLFQGMICQANAAYNPSGSYNELYYCSTHQSDSICSSGVATTLPQNGGIYAMGPSGACGTLTYCDQASSCNGSDNEHNAASLGCAVCKGQQTALQSVVNYFNSLGNSLVSADSAYLQFYGTGAPAPSGGFIQQYCSDHGISQRDCCYQNAASRALVGNICATSAGTLPAASSGTDFTNSSQYAMRDLFWPYVIKPLVTVGKLNPDIIQISSSMYSDAIANAFTTWIATQPQDMSGWQQQAQQDGWLLAGSYYFEMSQGNNNNQELAMPTFQVSTSDPYAQPDNLMHNYRNNYSASNNLLTAMTQASSGGQQSNFAAATGGSSIGGMGTVISSGASDVVTLFMGTLNGNMPGQMQTNSLAALQHLGTGLLNIADAIFLVFLIASTVILYSIGWSALVLGSGPLNPMATSTVGVILIIVPILLALLAFLYTAGGLLAVYTPLIPYVIYTLGAVGWMIGVIEAMIAGPLIALGILSPGKGGHEILGKAEPALMGMFGLFLRPSLMVVGMIAAMMLSAAAVTMLNSTFAGVVGQIVGRNPAPSIALFFMAAYVGLVLAILNKAFSLIHIIPDRVLAWIGGQHAPGGGHGEAGEALKGTEGKVGGAAAGAGSLAAGAAKPMSTRAEGSAKHMTDEALKDGKGEKSGYSYSKEGGIQKKTDGSS